MTHNDEVVVNGLRLPPGLVDALRQGSWTELSSSESLATVFDSEPVRPRFFTLDEIVAVNGYWMDESDPAYLGEASEARYPGDIDPKRSLIVAELGPDQLIALDYRRSAAPEVLFASDDPASPWWLVSRSVDDLLSELTQAR
jgi:hypothetical protein